LGILRVKLVLENYEIPADVMCILIEFKECYQSKKQGQNENVRVLILIY